MFKPKPFSIRQRLLMVEAASMTLVLWILVAALGVSLKESGDVQGLGLWLLMILAGGSSLAVVLLWTSRRMQERHLWEPVQQMGRMVRQIRSGSLAVQAEIPRSVELGPLLDSFVQMADELREARKALEEKVKRQSVELDSAQRKLVEAAKLAALGQLVSGVAHEVNNPLTSILGFAEVALGNPSLDAATRRQIQVVRDEALRLRNVVANLSSFARRAPQHRSRFPLAKVLERIVELRRYQLAASGIALHCAPGPPAWVEGDSDQLLQVLFNLLLNAEQAIRAVRETGDIWLACHVEQDEARIAVRDNGVGMTSDVLEHIFEPYFTTKPVGQGSGLGLSISHGIAAQHSGRILVESEAGAGSTFTLVLPLAASRETKPDEVPAPAAASTPTAAPRCALVVDDEPDIGEFVQMALERRGWQVTVLTDSLGVEAALAASEFDIVLSDLKMPARSGLEVCRVIESLRPDLARRFLLMTGNLADAERESLDLSTLTVLRKPFTLAQLDEAVRMLDRQSEAAPAARAASQQQ